MNDSNIYALAAREKKAAALLDAIEKYGWADLATHMEAQHWASLARKAGVNPPSPETIQLVLDRLERRKAQGA